TAFRSTRPIGAFNRKWGLPLPQRMALQMGTVLVCKSPSDAQWQELATFVRDGVGESREDGYGRIGVNWQSQPSFLMTKPEKQEAPIIPLPPDSASRHIATQMIKRMQQAQIEQRVVAKANGFASNARVKASKSQIYRLRLKVQATLQKAIQVQRPNAAADQCTSDAVTDNLRAYMKDLQSRRSTRDQFKKTRIDTWPILSWIGNLLAETTPQSPEFQQINVQIGDVKTNWTEIMTLETNLRLINAVLAQIGKKEANNG
ncbi:MAG: hypothetical protein GY805_33195, partial [Chloroflexi bacterium]|nr:hypothetical protein [Chloroflexota bacterium]